MVKKFLERIKSLMHLDMWAPQEAPWVLPLPLFLAQIPAPLCLLYIFTDNHRIFLRCGKVSSSSSSGKPHGKLHHHSKMPYMGVVFPGPTLRKKVWIMVAFCYQNSRTNSSVSAWDMPPYGHHGTLRTLQGSWKPNSPWINKTSPIYFKKCNLAHIICSGSTFHPPHPC